ncbi:MAG TPA: transcription termination factor Rho [Marmoricola sp.]|nr:transcription termination factor Rho [Marmoricola sp.]
MSETAGTTVASSDAEPGRPARKTGGLSSKLLPELKQIAGGLGIKGVSTMKKAQLVDAIRAAQSGSAQSGSAQSASATAAPATTAPAQETPRAAGRSGGQRLAGQREEGAQESRAVQRASRENRDRDEPGRERSRNNRSSQRDGGGEQSGDRDQGREQSGDREQGRERSSDRDQGREQSGNRDQGRQAGHGDQSGSRNQGQQAAQGTTQGATQQSGRNQGRDDEETGGNRRRRRRGRDRDRQGNQPNQGGQSGYRDRARPPQEVDLEVTEDDVLVPVAGIVDILDNYAFVRTSGYLPGPDDVYVSLSMVRKHGLRKGDAVTGEVRQPREGDSKQKFNPLVRLDTVNGGDVEAAKRRVDFNKLTPLYPSERLRLETEAQNMIGRVIDIAAPIGKGQRGLIVSPAKAGKTMIMQSIANSITTNNPECHLMVVLVDERPEEVTDFQRSVKGEVISSTFDRPASDHTMVAELAIERAKRLVELGHDVVVLLDGITRLGRAYNLAAPASGRILSGGVDSAALYPPKRFFGAARNIEDGGSLTILATALIESGSKMDEVIFEEFKGTGNMEIRLRRDFADKRLFPAIDAVQSGTRREELLMSKEELAIVWKLRRVLSGLDGQQALELLLERLKKTHSNIEFLMQVQKSTPSTNSDD